MAQSTKKKTNFKKQDLFDPHLLSNKIKNPPFTAFVASIKVKLEEALLRQYFKGLDITSISFPVDMSTIKAKGFAFVEFKSSDDFFEALTMNGQKIENGGVIFVSASNRVELLSLPKCPESIPRPASAVETKQILEAARRGQIRYHLLMTSLKKLAFFKNFASIDC